MFLLSFEDMGSASFSDEYQFCRTFLRLLKTQIDYGMAEGIAGCVSEVMGACMDQSDFGFPMMKNLITHMCMDADRSVVLIIDEVNQASNNQISLDFLAILRSMYSEEKIYPNLLVGSTRQCL